jgi:hypothetical protein
MEVLFNIHLDLIKASETFSLPPPLNIQYEAGSLLVCFLRYGLQGPKCSSPFNVCSIVTHLTQWQHIDKCYILFSESWPPPYTLKVLLALQANVCIIPEEEWFLQKSPSSAF